MKRSFELAFLAGREGTRERLEERKDKKEERKLSLGRLKQLRGKEGNEEPKKKRPGGGEGGKEGGCDPAFAVLSLFQEREHR